MSDNATVDYGNEAALFDYGPEADKSPSRSRKSRRQVIRYRRFPNAADAIRFAIEELPVRFFTGVYMEVDDVRFNSRAIRQLYDSVEYPLVRRAAA